MVTSMLTAHPTSRFKQFFLHFILFIFVLMTATTNGFSNASHASSSKSTNKEKAEIKRKIDREENGDDEDDDCDDEEDDDDDEDEDEDDDEISQKTNDDESKKANTDDPLNNVEAFPFTWLKPAAATLAANNATTIVNQDNAPYTITGYFSPTCGHCGHFFKTELPVIQTKYINPGKIKFGIRPYCHHPIDFIVTQLAWSRGADHFLEAFSLFMVNQDVWFEFLVTPAKEIEKRKEIINKMIEKLPATIDRSKILVKFNINEENPNSSIILFALANGFSIEEVDTALHSEKADDLANRLIVALLAAKDDEGKGITAIPTFYVNDKYQKEPLTLDDFESIVKTGKIIERPKEPTQTTVPTTSPINNPAAQAFASITPPKQ